MSDDGGGSPSPGGESGKGGSPSKGSSDSGSAPQLGGSPSGPGSPPGDIGAPPGDVSAPGLGTSPADLGQTGATFAGPDAANWAWGTDANGTANNAGLTPQTGSQVGGTSPGTEIFTGAAGAGGAAPASSALNGLPGVGETPPDLSSKIKGGTAGGTSDNSGSGGILNSLGIKNPLVAAVGAGGLGYALSQGQAQTKYSPELEAQARSLNTQGQQLLSYLQSGTLPAGLQASLNQATSAAKAKIISNYAAQGLNTDPSQNSALQQQLQQVDQQALISTAQMGQQLMQSGIQETGLSSDLYKTLVGIDQTQTANIGKAIASFASALSGGGGGINLKLGS